jgi:hypothetical protein
MLSLVLSARGCGNFGAEAANASAAHKSTAKHALYSLLGWNHILNHQEYIIVFGLLSLRSGVG